MSNLKNVAVFAFENYHVYFKGLLRTAKNQPLAFSFNISDRCPVGCQCYWRAQARVTELSDDEVLAFFERKREEGYIHANIIGGEPYVRPTLLSKVVRIMPTNWVVTSATTPLRALKNTTHMVSIDGGNETTHDSIRKMPGLYRRILKNVSHARASGYFPIVLHTTLNAVNFREVENILQTWSQNGLADGIIISTMTPIKGSNDETLRLSRDQRIWIVEELLRLKKRYPKFLLISEKMIRRLHPDHTMKLNPRLCATAKYIESYDAAGKRIPQCVLSDKADCKECGCIVTIMSDNFTSWNLSSITERPMAMLKTVSIHD